MAARSKGFWSGFSHRDCEPAIVWKTARLGLKSSGEVKNLLRKRLLKILVVGRRAKGDGGEAGGFTFAFASLMVLLEELALIAHRLVKADCGLVLWVGSFRSADVMLGRYLEGEMYIPLAMLSCNCTDLIPDCN